MSELFERFRKLLPKPLPEVNIDYFRKEVTKRLIILRSECIPHFNTN